ncbi:MULTISPECIES: 5' DNA nuclease [Rhizobium]|uniref:5' DNA nuclease n=1 Tax=Rhizobium tropici TaxID=398 RepID=A0A6P1CEC9_RHITR|nr:MULTISPECIES: 5' DNA nuclease [Rhizobium]AGB70786.1 putative NADH-quinone oxidoreductase subunit e [Rhizobium tropici CIAT 899]MBB4244913.1 NADH-quinone oxidoreductase subunit E [Rhizobium tropici]MBB5596371.1 NADH-quinone oxidoreductase subunit E [Rhizobium tropici]MBB6495253.1 NADH-quinone oxidoreductase subunit E [Rhizobium tropici]NEV14113.1 5' DNA nuclease [Rhizobium tropici]
MAKTNDIRQESGAAGNTSADLGRAAADMFGNAPIMPIHPLMAHPAAAIAAVTAIGFGFTSQLAGAFLGAFQGAVEATTRLADALEDEKHPAEVAAKPAGVDAGAGDAKPVKPEAAAKEAAVKPVAPKPVAAKQKPAAVKKAEPKPAVVAPKAVTAPAKKTAKVEAAVPVAVKPVPARGRKAAEKADDLKRISGVGPKLEQVLNGRGIKRFADIAAWSDADIERIDGELGFEGRIRRDDWVGQAKELLPKGRS